MYTIKLRRKGRGQPERTPYKIGDTAHAVYFARGYQAALDDCAAWGEVAVYDGDREVYNAKKNR